MFNLETFDIKLDTDFIGRNFIYSEEVLSTNSMLLEVKNNFKINGTTLFAERQIKGRGRRDNVWYSNKGLNLTFSILLSDKKYLNDKLSIINFAASLSVATAIENLFQLKVGLKWPNDVLIRSKKCAGILIESSSKGDRIESAVVGMGINVNQTYFTGNFNIEPTSVKLELNQNIERENFLAEILNIFEELLLKLYSDTSYILKEWKSRCGMIGEKVTVSDGKANRYGIFDDIDENGLLLLKTKDGIEKIFYGDVSLS